MNMIHSQVQKEICENKSEQIQREVLIFQNVFQRGLVQKRVYQSLQF
jgi:hypothetical protein